MVLDETSGLMKRYDSLSRTEEDVRQINRLIDVENKSVLEIGCGTGRITFHLAERASEIVAIDIDGSAIREALNRNPYANVRFLVENIETTRLGEKFDAILSTWMGYMYLKSVPKAIENISQHLKDDGVFLLLCGYYGDEFHKIVRMLIGEKAKNVSFYSKLEESLSKCFTFERHILKGQLVFSSKKDIIRSFQLELANDYGMILDNHHKQRLKDYLKTRDELTIRSDSLAYLCKKHL